MQKKALSLFLVLMIILMAATLCCAGMISQNYRMPASTFSAGGTRLVSGSYILESSLGQAPPLMDQDNLPWSASYYMFPGFWYTLDGLVTTGCVDTDNDSICDDGDNSGTAGDNPCRAGNTVLCDDNCPDDANPGQEDSDNDTIGDVCDPCDNDLDLPPDLWGPVRIVNTPLGWHWISQDSDNASEVRADIWSTATVFFDDFVECSDWPTGTWQYREYGATEWIESTNTQIAGWADAVVTHLDPSMAGQGPYEFRQVVIDCCGNKVFSEVYYIAPVSYTPVP